MRRWAGPAALDNAAAPTGRRGPREVLAVSYGSGAPRHAEQDRSSSPAGPATSAAISAMSPPSAALRPSSSTASGRAASASPPTGARRRGRHRLEVCGYRRRGAHRRSCWREHRPLAAVCFAALIDVAELVARPDLYWDRNYFAPMRFFRALVAGGVRHLVFSSTAAVYAGASGTAALAEDGPLDPASPYGLTKLACELMLQGAGDSHRLAPGVRFDAPEVDWPPPPSASGLAARRVRGSHEPCAALFQRLGRAPGGGPGRGARARDASHPARAGRRARRLGRGERGRPHRQRRRLPHPRRHLRARLRARPRPGRCARGGHRVPARRRTRATPSTWAAARATASARSSPPSSGRPGEGLATRVGPRRAGDPASLVADIGKAGRLLGWRPRRDLEEIVASAAEFHRRHGFT